MFYLFLIFFDLFSFNQELKNVADQLFVNSSLEGLTLSSYKRNEKIPSIFMKIGFCSFGFFLFFKKNILIKKHITSNYKNFFYSLSRGLPVSIFFWLIAYMVKKKNIERNDYIENVLILMIYIYRSIFCINEKKTFSYDDLIFNMFKNNDKKRDIIKYYCEKKSSRRISTVLYLQFNSGSKFKACKIINIPQLNIATIIKGIKDKKLYSSFIIEEESDSEIE